MIEEKIVNIQALLKEQKIETLCIGNFGHQVRDDLLYYLLLTHLELGIMCIPQKGKPVLYAIPFEVSQLSKEYPNIIVKPLTDSFNELLKKQRIPLGYRHTSLPAKQYIHATSPRSKRSDIVLLYGEEKLMARKLQEEQVRLKKAANITDDIFAEVVARWNSFETEQDVAKAIHISAIEKGVELSFPTIVASGTNASNPHHVTLTEALQPGFCVIDMGVRYMGYCSDMTRTIYIGEPSDEEVKTYNHILKAQEQAISEVQVGETISAIAKNCRTNLGNEFEKHFIHSLGHGLGTQVHEWPRVSKKEDTKLEEGMCITIEPGVYISEAWGIRIEDDVLASKKGPEVLTKSSKQLICV